MQNRSNTYFPSRRSAIAWIGLALGSPSVLAEAGFPSRPIRIIYPFSAGTGGDLIARTIAQKISDEIRQPVTVDNRVGASGAIGTIAAARSAPDGYTLLMAVSPFTIAAGIDPKVGYDPVKDFTPVAKIVTAPLLFTVNADVPFKNIQQLVAYAKENPRKLSYGSSGSGTSAQIELELFKQAAKIDLLEVPYKATSQLLTDLIEGRIAIYAGVAPVVMPHVQSGRLRVLAVVDSRRSPSLPDVPALAEALQMPGYVATPNWYGFLAPAGTPSEAVKRLGELIKAAMGTPEMTQLLERFGAQRYTPSNEEFAQQIKTEVQRTALVAKSLRAPKQ